MNRALLLTSMCARRYIEHWIKDATAHGGVLSIFHWVRRGGAGRMEWGGVG